MDSFEKVSLTQEIVGEDTVLLTLNISVSRPNRSSKERLNINVSIMKIFV